MAYLPPRRPPLSDQYIDHSHGAILGRMNRLFVCAVCLGCTKWLTAWLEAQLKAYSQAAFAVGMSDDRAATDPRERLARHTKARRAEIAGTTAFRDRYGRIEMETEHV